MNITTDNFVNTQLTLLLDIIDLQVLFSIIVDEKCNLILAESYECVNHYKKRISEAQNLKKKYLSILN